MHTPTDIENLQCTRRVAKLKCRWWPEIGRHLLAANIDTTHIDPGAVARKLYEERALTALKLDAHVNRCVRIFFTGCGTS